MERYVVKDGKRLRLGYTTGSCAAAAAKAAAWMLLTGRRREEVSIVTPSGVPLELAVREISLTGESCRCAVEKDSGDDPDVTKGALIFAEVTRSAGTEITIDGGEGVGRVTKPGLDQPVGAAAINSVPRKMIRENVEEIRALLDEHGGLAVTVSCPQGAELAKRTFNPRLGIVGGISILGTTGIVEPMSEEALVETIRVELRQKRAGGAGTALLTPGNYGADFLRDGLALDAGRAVMTSNFIGDALDAARDLGYRAVLLVGHVGKLVKLAGGMFNTHSRYGDCRMEILASFAAASELSSAGVEAVLDCATCDEALRVIGNEGFREETLRRLSDRIGLRLKQRAGEHMAAEAILFSRETGLLCRTDGAEALLREILEG